MSIHISAGPGDLAETVLLPGDPLRAQYIADNFLQDVHCYNKVRGMLGFTGTYKGKRVSVQGTGMGIPSISIYLHELIQLGPVKQAIRIGSCGSIQKDIKVRDVLLAMTASTDSRINQITFSGRDYSPTADFGLFTRAMENAKRLHIPLKAGNVFSSDSFYHEEPNYWDIWSRYKVMAIEMETTALYTIAALKGIAALSILTVSDSLVSGEVLNSKERETTFRPMFELALSLL